ncbi:hypothetical protein FI667_g9087, partial [Globisporangium splendens]
MLVSRRHGRERAACASLLPTVLLLFSTHTAAAGDAKPPLVARVSSSSPSPPSLSFRVLQLSDLHFTGDPTWPCRDAPYAMRLRRGNSNNNKQQQPVVQCNEALMTTFVDALLDAEKPDFVVFAGDNVQTFQPQFHQKAVDAFTQGVEARQIPHAEILGNHDDDYGFPREQVLAMGMQKRYSYTQRGPRNVHGVGNYELSVQAPIDGPWGMKGENVFHMYFLDSGGRLDKSKYPDVNSRYDWIHDDQVEYYRVLAQANHDTADTKEPLPAIMFFHIALREFMHASIEYWRRTGEMNEKVEPSDVHSGLYAELVRMREVKAAFVGHDHTNAYCYLRDGIQWCAGGGTGFGEAYSDPEFTRRARVIEWSVNSANERTIRSWKRLYGRLDEKVEEEVLFTQNATERVGLLVPPNASHPFIVFVHMIGVLVLLVLLFTISVLLLLQCCRKVATTRCFTRQNATNSASDGPFFWQRWYQKLSRPSNTIKET